MYLKTTEIYFLVLWRPEAKISVPAELGCGLELFQFPGSYRLAVSYGGERPLVSLLLHLTVPVLLDQDYFENDIIKTIGCIQKVDWCYCGISYIDKLLKYVH